MTQLTGITKPLSPFRRVDIPTPQSQQPQQLQQPRKASSGLPNHFRPQLPPEQSFVPPSNNNWAPPTLPKNPSSDLSIRPNVGSYTR